MAKTIAPLLPSTSQLLQRFGERLRLARRRRRLTAKQVAERAGMSPMTLRSLERGGSGVTMGAYLAVMQVLGIEQDLSLLGQADPMGRELQDAQLPAQKLRKGLDSQPSEQMRKTLQAQPQTQLRKAQADLPSMPLRKAVDRPDAPSKAIKKLRHPAASMQDWITKSDFASSAALVGLLDPVAPLKKKAR